MSNINSGLHVPVHTYIHTYTHMYMHGICIKKEEEKERMGKEGERYKSNRDSVSTS